MILQLNHFNGKAASATTQNVVETLYRLLEEGHISQAQFSYLRVQLDWIQYKQNFREMVTCSRSGHSPLLDLRIDTRQATPDLLRTEMLRAMQPANGDDNGDRLVLEDFKSFRNSIVWDFNTFVLELPERLGKGHRQRLRAGTARRQVGRQSRGGHRRQRGRILDSPARSWIQSTNSPPRFSFSKSASGRETLRHVRREIPHLSTSSRAQITIPGCAS